MRTNEWLTEQLAMLWYRYFDDIDQPNDVVIKFGQPAITRLGSIKWGRKPLRQQSGALERRSIITITSHLKDPKIPDEVVLGVMAHELVHYAHGFSSPRPQLYKHPHHGGVVDRELAKRGLGAVLKFQENWLKKHWTDYVRANHKVKRSLYGKLSFL